MVVGGCAYKGGRPGGRGSVMTISEKSFRDLRDWADKVQKKFRGRLSLVERSQQLVEGYIASVFYTAEVDPTLPAAVVIRYVHGQGMAYGGSARYFFVFDKEKKFLFLQIYAYEGN